MLLCVTHALFALLVVFTPPRGGEPVLAPHVRARGGEAYVTELGAWVHSAAELEHVSPSLLAFLLYLESSGDSSKVEPKTGSEGLMQLNPGSPWGMAWKHACELEPDRCEELNVVFGARALRAGFDACGDDAVQAVSFYRSGRCVPKKRKVRRRSAWVVERAAQLESGHGST
jgi:hypothetical protein